MGVWLLLILGALSGGIGLSWLFAGNYSASTAAFLLAILLVLLALVTKKGRKV